MPTPLTLNPHRHAILLTLWEYRYLTTQQLHGKALPHLCFSSAWAHLNALRRMAMVTSHRVAPDEGNRSALYWLLTKQGAEAIGQAERYSKHYRRRPERERLTQRGIELELERNIIAAGWQLLKPVRYSRAHPHPTFTEMVNGQTTVQVQTLIDVIRESEGRAIRELQARDPNNLELGQRSRNYAAHSYTSAVYFAAPNDYLSYVLGAKARANVLILCPPNAAERFWQKRIERYTRLLRYVKVFAVFATTEQANAHRPVLKGSGFEIRTVAELAKAAKKGGESRS